MRRSSLRVWLLLVSSWLAVLIIGGLSLATYTVFTDAMTAAARDASSRTAEVIRVSVEARAEGAAREAAEAGLDGEARDREATRLFLGQVTEMLDAGGSGTVEAAIYDASHALIWSSDAEAVVNGTVERRRAWQLGHAVESVALEGSAISGLFGAARIDVHVVHAPLYLPDGSRGIMDITYLPRAEESVIDSVRVPMVAIALAGTVMMVLMIQAGIGWVLKLIADLQHAAESIDAGRLDAELPVTGDHEIARLARTLNGLIARLRHRAVIQTRFVADASHELATPVAGIRGYTNILRAWGAEDVEVREEAVEAIDRESRRMARLCGDLLSLVKSEQVTDFAVTPFNVTEVAREVMASAITRYKDKGVRHEGPPDVELPVISEPSRYEDALSVLVDNAYKYTPEGGTISLECWAEEETVVARITDTGIGIPESDLPNIFERFYRSDASRSKHTGGFGLGLPIAKAAIESLGGIITVESAENVGTTFTVVIPKAPPSQERRGDAHE